MDSKVHYWVSLKDIHNMKKTKTNDECDKVKISRFTGYITKEQADEIEKIILKPPEHLIIPVVEISKSKIKVTFKQQTLQEVP